MFRFRLQRILELRRSEVDRLRLDVAAAQRQVQVARETLEQNRRARERHDRACDDTLGRALTVLELRGRLATAEALAARQRELDGELERAIAALRERRQVLLETHRKVKALERLREKKREAHEAEIEAQERKVLDDIRGRTGGLRPRHSASPSRGPR